MPATRDSYNANFSNPKNVYTQWYAARNAVSGASSAKLAEVEQRVHAVIKERDTAVQRVHAVTKEFGDT